MEQIWNTIQKGVFHVLDYETYDHILYVVVIVAPFLFNKWKRILSLISIFILGHLLTLLLARFDVINIDRKIVVFLIPAILLIIAIYNILTTGKRALQERFGIIFFLSLITGLLHGFVTDNIFTNLFKSSENQFLYILETSFGMWLGLLILAFITVFLSFLGQTIFRFKSRDWVLVISALATGLLIPMLKEGWIF